MPAVPRAAGAPARPMACTVMPQSRASSAASRGGARSRVVETVREQHDHLALDLVPAAVVFAARRELLLGALQPCRRQRQRVTDGSAVRRALGHQLDATQEAVGGVVGQGQGQHRFGVAGKGDQADQIVTAAAESGVVAVDEPAQHLLGRLQAIAAVLLLRHRRAHAARAIQHQLDGHPATDVHHPLLPLARPCQGHHHQQQGEHLQRRRQPGKSVAQRRPHRRSQGRGGEPQAHPAAGDPMAQQRQGGDRR